MAGKQRKSSSFSFFKLFKGKSSSRSSRNGDDISRDDVKAYKVWPSDGDTGRWVAEPGIDHKVPDYLSTMIKKWKDVGVAN